MKDESEIVDWRSADIWIYGQPKALDGLLLLKAELEKLVGPHVSRSKTCDVISYKGKRRFLKPSPLPPSVREAAEALQFLYGIEAAIKAGDIDKAIRMAWGCAPLTDEIRAKQYFNVSQLDAVVGHSRLQRDRIKGGQGKRKLKTPEQKAIALRTINEFSGTGVSKDSACVRAASKLKQLGICDVSKDTLLRLLRESNGAN